MVASKRKPATSPKPEPHDEDEKALDPKLAEHPDEDESETSKPPTKRQKKSTSSSPSKTSSRSAVVQGGAKVEKSYGGAAYAKSGDGWHRSDFNPAPKGRSDNRTPLNDLEAALKDHAPSKNNDVGDGKNVVYWMRMHDLRVHDNRALAHASKLAEARQKKGKGGNLVALFVITPADYRAHDRGARRIDFVLRTLASLKEQFDKLNIPFVVYTHEGKRTQVGEKVLELCGQWNASQLTGNIEYEVDELWRDISVVESAKSKNVAFSLFHDCYVVPPGRVLTNDGRPYSVFSPWNRRWTDCIAKDMSLIEASPDPAANEKSIHKDSTLGKLFSLDKLGEGYGIPKQLPGFECKDTEYMAKLWPVRGDAPKQVLDNFMKGKGGETALDRPANEPSTADVGANAKESRLGRYAEGRNLLNENGTSRISPYLAAGLVSARECLRRTKEVTKNKLTVGRDSGAAMWNTEISFRDFYGHVLAAWPKVCMGHAFITKYEDVKWETDPKTLQAWKEGKTGYPIVDAAQRQCIQQGYIHNRGRMITAMFLTKHLLHDWREGERHFSLNFIDQDFASNNGGWQWSASTGTDPQPYFRIFNPLSQSEKSDPQGDYIRHFVPELKNVKGNAIHDPFHRLGKAEFAKLGYPEPIVEHAEARQRALRRYKNPGDE
ncbi:DNA photolyase, FAD-binding/Cryptochrome, C-terminal [Kalmanozyma brasiliensis GHG001]|uniref:Deoxyribodipyrimidine photolyase n=1 Tax=Kalmanozyma brasiliensis (strain GHG001) TaxID=1365824 RepID=V5EAE4_KALBG|nr:DNA photolyase, FAD-binding/Cryptochrome, C-terminal [Kalmanozyma brasiliensis GHG001]EST07371.1 DNA photolyase, FAD-binding/Cryptochrome, C-terminal [Kalmanozyma brasiliensis GHG001]